MVLKLFLNYKKNPKIKNDSNKSIFFRIKKKYFVSYNNSLKFFKKINPSDSFIFFMSLNDFNYDACSIIICIFFNKYIEFIILCNNYINILYLFVIKIQFF